MIDILQMRLHSEKEKVGGVHPQLVAAGRELFRLLTFDGISGNRNADFDLAQVAKACLIGEGGYSAVKAVCVRLREAVSRHETHAIYNDDLLEGLFAAQPIGALDGLCGGCEDELHQGVRILLDVRSRKDLLSSVPGSDLIRWCEEGGRSRYIAIAGVITVFRRSSQAGPWQWAGVALELLERSPDPEEVLRRFVSQFATDYGWCGSRAEELDAKVALLDELVTFPGIEVSVAREKARLLRVVREQREAETTFERQRDERFE